jgi:UDP-N-acetylglucosamine 2-epimerase (non-hydrolysing)
MKKILHVVGARPNFMKVAPVYAALDRLDGIAQNIVHTGQHYDRNMSEVFFRQLEIPEPDINLEVGSGSHAQQTAQIISRLEPTMLNEKPELVLVYGDVNSTVAAALVCAKLLIPVGHVEAGLRSFDRSMPEEINRLLTDQIADLLFTPSGDGDENLLREGVSPEKIHLVGNVMIDTLKRLLPQALDRRNGLHKEYGILEGKFGLVTLHRPSNVDDAQMLEKLISALDKISQTTTLVFPIHPRTKQRLIDLKIKPKQNSLKLIDPMGYLDFLALQAHAKFLITDSGGIQEETTYLGIPCLTVRNNTERPVTVEQGTNVLVGQDMTRLKIEVERIIDGTFKKGRIPPLWDGRAGERIAEIIGKQLG